MNDMSDDPAVVDERSASRFKLEIDGHVAELLYGRKGDHLTLVHTEVPEELGGRGLGGQLVRAAVDVAEAAGPHHRAPVRVRPGLAGEPP